MNGVLERGAFILQPEIDEFEEQVRNFVGAKYCVTCTSGTTALFLGMKALIEKNILICEK